MRKLTGLYILDPQSLDQIYGPSERHDIEQFVDFIGVPQTRRSVADNPAILHDAEVIISGWAGPILDEPFLQAAPRLKAFFYGAGTVGHCITPGVWERGILVTTANAANAVPVAEYTLANILFSLKHGWRLARATRERRTFVERGDVPGAYGSIVGLISLGTIGRTVLQRLRGFDLRILAHDPFVSKTEARTLGVELVSLKEIFEQSHVVSLHSPSLEETKGLITGAHFESMRPGGVFINTSRGAVVRETEMLDVAARRPDLQFILDVVEPEPPAIDSPLYTLPNILLTPHIAGSVGSECRRMGRYMVEELQRYVAGKPLQWLVTPESARHSTHRPVTLTTYVKKAAARTPTTA
jgi:phosphoglycerate dehydrogenase-like enzyme